MSLLDDIEASRGRPGGHCGIPAILAALGDERAELEAAFASDAESSAIARALTARGHDVRAYTLARHRRGECRCPR